MSSLLGFPAIYHADRENTRFGAKNPVSGGFTALPSSAIAARRDRFGKRRGTERPTARPERRICRDGRAGARFPVSVLWFTNKPNGTPACESAPLSW